MPKAWVAKNLQPDLPLSHGAALILGAKLPEVMHYRAAALAGTVDGIHDMRVASKRLREALRVLRPTLVREARRELLPVVEELNDTLGQVRDRDVLRGAFRQMMRADCRLGDLQPLRRQLARERRRAHGKLARLLDKLKRGGFSREYSRLMAELEQRPAAGQPVMAAFAAAAVGARLRDVMDNVHAVSGAYRAEAFHRERIRVKKLKYALEPFLPILGADLKGVYALVSDLQEFMGLVHDLDVQRETIAAWVAAHELSESLRLALQQIARERRALLKQTRGHLERMLAEDFEGRLLAALGTPADHGQEVAG